MRQARTSVHWSLQDQGGERRSIESRISKFLF
jgi:hypothetical protein